MMNPAVVHLASMAEVGTTVTVVQALPKSVEVSQSPQTTRESQPATATPRNSGVPVPANDYRHLRDYALRRR